MIPIQFPDVSNALREAFGLKGRVRANLDESVAPVVQVYDLATSPYAANPVPCQSERAQGAVVGENGHLWVQPAPNALLRTMEFDIFNETAGALIYVVLILTPANIATLVSTSLEPLRNMNARFVGGAPALVASASDRATEAGIVGLEVLRFQVAGESDKRVVIPGGWSLYGDDALGIGGFCIACLAANTAVRSNFHCQEWRLQA